MSSNTVNQRVNFASTKNPLEYPDFLEVQLKSFQDFLQLDTPPEKRKNEGLYKVFAENFPIADTRNNFVLEFTHWHVMKRNWQVSKRVRLLMIQNFLNIIWAICGRKDTDLKKSVTW